MYDIIQFIWGASEDGYEWLDGPFATFSKEQPVGTEPALVPLGEASRSYHPRDYLFLEFAGINAEEDGQILAFANSYGLLGGGPLWITPKHKGETRSVQGELRSYWQQHLHRMKAAVSLWAAIKGTDREVLDGCIHWKGRERITYQWPPANGEVSPWRTHATIASREINPHLLDRFRPGDTRMPARVYLQEVVNKSLSELAAPCLLWAPADREKMGLFIAPRNLIGCLWLQLASAIAESRKFRFCEAGCGKAMLIAPEGTGYRTNRKTCSNACRIKLYTRRKIEARQLRDQKVPIREIAKRLDTDVEQIKTWIAER